jgi:hypothetical protein
MAEEGAICGDGMCPYVPCKDFPNCNHLKEQTKLVSNKKKTAKRFEFGKEIKLIRLLQKTACPSNKEEEQEKTRLKIISIGTATISSSCMKQLITAIENNTKYKVEFVPVNDEGKLRWRIELVER